VRSGGVTEVLTDNRDLIIDSIVTWNENEGL
jgi:hypothetical protein